MIALVEQELVTETIPVHIHKQPADELLKQALMMDGTYETYRRGLSVRLPLRSQRFPLNDHESALSTERQLYIDDFMDCSFYNP
jgi:hypothetical protein